MPLMVERVLPNAADADMPEVPIRSEQQIERMTVQEWKQRLSSDATLSLVYDGTGGPKVTKEMFQILWRLKDTSDMLSQFDSRIKEARHKRRKDLHRLQFESLSYRRLKIELLEKAKKQRADSVEYNGNFSNWLHYEFLRDK